MGAFAISDMIKTTLGPKGMVSVPRFLLCDEGLDSVRIRFCRVQGGVRLSV